MKLYKDYTKKPYPFSMNDTAMLRLPQSIKIQEELITKMTISEKIKIIDHKIDQNEAQYDLDRQTAKISALSPGNVSIYKFLSDKTEKVLLEKATAIKRFEYSP